MRHPAHLIPLVMKEIFDRIRQAVLAADPEGNILAANEMAHQMFGFEENSLTGLNLSVLFTDEDLTYFYPNLLYLAKNHQIFDGEAVLKRSDGSTFFAHMVFHPCRAPETGCEVIGVAVQNIDEQKQLEKVIKETHFEDLVKVANGIAHEIRNPLVGIGGLVTRLYHSCDLNPKNDKYYEHIIDNVKKIEGLLRKVDTLVSLPRPILKSQSLLDLLQCAAQPFLAAAQDKDIEVHVDAPDRPVILDPDLILTGLGLLIQNALDAIVSHGKITLSAEVNTNEYRISVSDTGSGIKKEDLPYIFIPFFSTKANGNGIDLSVVKRIAEGHGGELNVDSTYGGGARFTFVLPLERRRKIRTTSLATQA